MTTTEVREPARVPTRLELGSVDTDGLTPESVEYAALLPEEVPERLRFAYLLHGGGGSRDFLTEARPWVEKAWERDLLPPCVVVTPSVTPRCFYMNFPDGSERWEDALLGPVLDHVRERFGASAERADTVALGPSMGGMGSLRMAFKHPEVFAGVAGLEPGIEPSLTFAGIELEDRFWRDQALFTRAYGDPIDEDYWQANNPASIAAADPDRLRDSGLSIYLECGDEDSFGLHRGTEFLHRVLYDNQVPHEYRLVRGADHIGATLPGRFADAFSFLGRVFDPPGPDPSLERMHTMIDRLRERAGLPPRPTAALRARRNS